MSPANDEADANRADVEAMIDALYRGAREAFIVERNLAAKRLSALGRGEDAARVKALGKPSVSAWAVNQLWWSHRPQMDTLLETARRQVMALQTGGGPAEQAAIGRARRHALDALLRTATEVLEAGGHATGAGTLRKISTSLEALAAHAVHGGGPTRGRLSVDLAPPGFELLGGLGSLSPSASPSPGEGSVQPPAERPAAHAHAEAALKAARERRDATRSRARSAVQALDRATTEADEAVLAAQQADARLDEAKAQSEAARQAEREAERVALGARAHARREQQRVADARRAAEGLRTELQRLDEAVQRAQAQLDTLG